MFHDFILLKHIYLLHDYFIRIIYHHYYHYYFLPFIILLLFSKMRQLSAVLSERLSS